MVRDLTPWRPFRELATLREEMNRLWDRFFGEREEELFIGEKFPSVDVSESEDKIVVTAEVPGMKPEEIDVSLSDGILTIKGERKQEKEEKDKNYHLVEIKYGQFSRSIRLPAEVKEDKVSAEYKNGILKITLPKTEEAKKKEIKIQVK